MGNPNPKNPNPKVPQKVLENRGSWRAKQKKLLAAAKEAAPANLPEDLLPLAEQITAEYDLPSIIKTLPNYDPYKDADDYEFCPLEAAKAIAFFHHFLKHVQGDKAGEPFVLESWQIAIVANLFGWQDNNKQRRYREALVLVARGNGKSALASGIALYCLLCGDDPGAEIYSCAGDRSQAAKVHDVAKQMILTSEPLLGLVGNRLGIYKNSITLDDFSFYKTVSSDAKLREGGNASAVFFDELHVQPNRQLYEVMKKSAMKRKNSLFFSISTAGTDLESICYEVYLYAKKVAEGSEVDARFLPVIFEPTAKDDWKLPSTWKLANPNLNISIMEAEIESACKRAQILPAAENDFKTKCLNIWTEQAERWLPMDAWDRCKNELPTEDQLKRHPCFGGLDLGLTEDLSAFALYWPQLKACKIWVWMPKDGIEEKEKLDRAKYRVWAKAGFIKFIEGNTTDYDVLEQDILAIYQEYKIQQIGVDRAYALPIVNHLLSKRVPLVEFGQGWQSFTSPSRELERMIISHEINHGANPVLRYCASNAALKSDTQSVADNCKPVKCYRYGRIDALVALIEALGVALRQPIKGSSYASRAAGESITAVKSHSTYAVRGSNG